jgi:hypothetical protein
MTRAARIRELLHGDDHFDLLSGDDFTLLPFLALGGHGVISVTSNVAPRWLAHLCEAAANNRWDEARSWHYRQLPLCRALFGQPNPIPVKAALALLGRCHPDMRLPLLAIDPQSHEGQAPRRRPAIPRTHAMSERLTPIIIVGARGRMGKTLLREIAFSDSMILEAAVDRSGGPGLGQDAGRLAGLQDLGVEVTDELQPRRNSVVVDFSLPHATRDQPAPLRRRRRPPDPRHHRPAKSPPASSLRAAAKDIPIVSAANFSVGVTVLTKIAGLVAHALGEQWDAEILEIHHSHKRDAPLRHRPAHRQGRRQGQRPRPRDLRSAPTAPTRTAARASAARSASRAIRGGDSRRRAHPHVPQRGRTPRAHPPRGRSRHLRPRRPAGRSLGRRANSPASTRWPMSSAWPA